MDVMDIDGDQHYDEPCNFAIQLLQQVQQYP